MLTATKIAATFRLELLSNKELPESPLGLWERNGPATVPTGLRIEPGTETSFTFKNDENYSGEDAHVCTAAVGEPFGTWLEVAYHAHRLSEGRKKALRRIVRVLGDTYYTDKISMNIQGVMSYSEGRGTSAAVLNGCKALAKDGLILLTHENGRKGWGDYTEADSRITGISERAIQMAFALDRTKRPVGYLPEGVDPKLVIAKLTEATRAATVRVAKRVHNAEVGGYGTYKLRINAPSRKEASIFTALEKRGFVRWTKKEPADRWSTTGTWHFDVPADSQLLRIACYLDVQFGTAMLIASEDE